MKHGSYNERMRGQMVPQFGIVTYIACAICSTGRIWGGIQGRRTGSSCDVQFETRRSSEYNDHDYHDGDDVSVFDYNRVRVYHRCTTNSGIRLARRLENNKKSIERVNGEKARGLPAVRKIVVRITQGEHGPRSTQRRHPVAQVYI